MAKKTPPQPPINVPVEIAIKTAANVWEFISLIAYDRHFSEFRNPLADEWREKYIRPLESRESTDVFSLERSLIRKLEYGRYAVLSCKPEDLSVYQMCILVHGQEWADLYSAMLKNNIYAYMERRYDELRSIHCHSPG